MNSKNTIFVVTVVAIIAVGMWLYNEKFSVDSAEGAAISEVTMFKNPGCQCCTKWANHLEKNSFTVIEQPTHQLASIKAEKNIPNSVQACHTAIVDDYVVEGHVPAEDVKRMLEEQPDVLGIGVGGMPIGSPGMEGPDPEPYTVYAFDSEGNQTVWARHQQRTAE